MDTEVKSLQFEIQDTINLDHQSHSTIFDFQKNCRVSKIINVKLEIPNPAIWKMNMIEYLQEKNILILAITNKVYTMQLNIKILNKLTISRNSRNLRLLYECEKEINEIKITYSNKKPFLNIVDMKGFLHILNLDNQENEVINNGFEEFKDNSCWSIDGYENLRICGGNHHKILVHDISNEGNTRIIHSNKHNVPSVRFSQCGSFISSASIDKHARIFDVFTGKILREYPTDEWSWGVIFAEKSLFSSRMIEENEYINDYSIENNFLNNSFGNDDSLIPRNFEEEKKEEDIIDKDVSRNDDIHNYFEMTPEENLEKYFFFHTSQYKLYIRDIRNDKNDNNSPKNLLGKINLFKNYLKTINHTNINPNVIYELKSYINNSRYDKLFISNRLKLLFVGNRAGDIQIFDLCLNFIKINGNERVVRFNRIPISIIKTSKIIFGIRIQEIDDYNLFVIVISEDKNLEIFKLTRIISGFNITLKDLNY